MIKTHVLLSNYPNTYNRADCASLVHEHKQTVTVLRQRNHHPSKLPSNPVYLFLVSVDLLLHYINNYSLYKRTTECGLMHLIKSRFFISFFKCATKIRCSSRCLRTKRRRRSTIASSISSSSRSSMLGNLCLIPAAMSCFTSSLVRFASAWGSDSSYPRLLPISSTYSMTMPAPSLRPVMMSLSPRLAKLHSQSPTLSQHPFTFTTDSKASTRITGGISSTSALINSPPAIPMQAQRVQTAAVITQMLKPSEAESLQLTEPPRSLTPTLPFPAEPSLACTIN